MLDSILHETLYIQNLYKDYLDTIKSFQNINRQSIFIKYYNIDIENSTYEENLESTYDLYSMSDVKFKLYEMTPAFFIQPLLNRSNNVPDIKGQFFEATTTVNLYSIKSPKINDIISFYNPIMSNEMLRVTNISTPTNAFYSTTALHWFELELEYAPRKIENLKLSNKFIYDLSIEDYLDYNTYVSKLTKFNQISTIFDKLLNYYNSKYDIYKVSNMIPLITNELIIYFKSKYSVNYNRIFDKYPTPYGYDDFFHSYKFKSLDEILNLNIIQPIINSYLCYDLDKKDYYRYIPEDGEENDIINLTNKLIIFIRMDINNGL